MKLFKRTSLEMRRVRWSTPRETFKTFIIAATTILIFVAIVASFTVGMSALIDTLTSGSSSGETPPEETAPASTNEKE